MAITIQCGQCGRSYTVNDSFARQKIACPNCQGPIDVPAAGGAFGAGGEAPGAGGGTVCVQCQSPIPDDATMCPVCGMTVIGRVPPEREQAKGKRISVVTIIGGIIGLGVVAVLVVFLIKYIGGMGEEPKEPPKVSRTAASARKEEVPSMPVPAQAEVEKKFAAYLNKSVARSKAASARARAKVEAGGALPASREEWGLVELELLSSEVTPRKDDVLSPYAGTATFKQRIFEYDEETAAYHETTTRTITNEHSYYMLKGWSAP